MTNPYLSTFPANEFSADLEKTDTGRLPPKSNRMLGDFALGRLRRFSGCVTTSVDLLLNLLRKYATQVVEDYGASLDARPAQPATEAVRSLDLLLTDASAYEHLMAPRAR